MKYRIQTQSAARTEEFAAMLAANLRGGEVIELMSDLGGGKTTFTRGLARGLGSNDRVTSPTFTVSKWYEGEKLNIAHFDFYRLADAGLMEHELQDYLNDPEIVTVVEWGDVVAYVLPKDRISVRLSRIADEKRLLEISGPKSRSYIMEGL